MYSDVVFIFFLQVGFRKYTIYFSSDKNFFIKEFTQSIPIISLTLPFHSPSSRSASRDSGGLTYL